MPSIAVKFGIAVVVAGFCILASIEVRGEDWVFYSGSGQGEEKELILRDWSRLNHLTPVPKAEAKTYHYYDRDSVASNSPSTGGSVRVWEKAVLQSDLKTYEEAREEIKKEEETRLKRKINILDYAWLFPLAVNRASKATETFYDIDCDSKEFFVLEVNNYDKEGKRMTREANMAMDLWFPIQPNTLMELLYKEICDQGK
jgi:hypothetical protein